MQSTSADWAGASDVDGIVDGARLVPEVALAAAGEAVPELAAEHAPATRQTHSDKTADDTTRRTESIIRPLRLISSGGSGI
jgi:hypothetical protein